MIAKQLSFDFEKYDHLEDESSKVQIHCKYKVRQAPKGGYGLHIMKDSEIRIEAGDIVNIYATERDILTAGGKVERVFTTYPTHITLGEFQWWNFVPVGCNPTIETITQLLKVKPTDLVTCVLYKSLA